MYPAPYQIRLAEQQVAIQLYVSRCTLLGGSAYYTPHTFVELEADDPEALVIEDILPASRPET